MTRRDDASPDGLDGPDTPAPYADESGDRPQRPPPRPRPPLVAGDIGLALRRVGAWIIDFTVAYFIVVTVVAFTNPVPTPDAAYELGAAVWLLAVPLAYRWAMQSALGFTLGKWALGLRLIDGNGQPPGPFTVFGREAAQLVLVYPLLVVPGAAVEGVPVVRTLLVLGLLGDVYLMFRRADTRALHDLPVRTQVTRSVR